MLAPVSAEEYLTGMLHGLVASAGRMAIVQYSKRRLSALFCVRLQLNCSFMPAPVRYGN